MSRANASARLAGSDMDKFIGYVTTVADVTQKSAESVGESFKTIYSRFGNVKAGKFVASQEEMNSSNYNEEEFESLNDIETVLSSIGIKLRENAKEWRDIDDVLQDIADSWDNWDKTTQNAVATAVAGTRQRENVLQLFDNWDEVDKYAEIAANSYGTATEKMEAYTDSVEAAQQRIQVAIEDWALWADGAGYIKDFYNAIGFAIKNIDDLIIAFSALAIALNLNGIISTFSNGITVLLSKITDVGMMFDRVKMNFATGKSTTISAATSGFSNVREDFIFAQQQMFGQALQKYTNTLNQQDAQAALNMQKEMLRMSATDKLTVAESLLTNVQLGNISDESKKHLANALTLILEDGEQKTILQKIASGQELSDSEDGLAALNYGLAELRKKQYKDAVADTMNKSGKMGEPGSMIANGVGMIIGGTAGAYGFGSAGESLLGDQGKIYGTMLGSMIGSYAGKALTNGLASAMAGKGFMAAITNPWTAIPAIVITGLLAGLAFFKKEKEDAIKEAEEEFKKSEEKYSAAKGSNITAKQYDELAEGVDAYGRNISLTDEEYEKFLSIGNELAELFPDLVIRTDEAGNSFVGLGNKVGGVTEKVEGLIKELEYQTDTNLLAEGTFGNRLQKDQESLEKYKDELKKTNDKIAEEEAKLTNPVFGDTVKSNAKKELKKLYKDRKDLEDKINKKNNYSSYTNAIIRTEMQDSMSGLTEDQQAFVENMAKNINYEGITNVDDAIDHAKDKISKYIDFIETNPAILENTTLDNNSYKTVNDQNKIKEDTISLLKEQFGDSFDEDEKTIILGLGFEIVDNKIIDPNNILTKFKEDFNVPIFTIDKGLISTSNLGKLTPEDAAKAYEYMKKGIIDVTDSMDTLVDLLYADREMPTTLEQARQYTEETLSLYGDLNEKVQNMTNTRGWENANVNEVFSKYPSAIRGAIKEAQEAFKKGELDTEEFLDSIESMTASKMIEIMGNLGEVEIQSVFGEDFLGDIDGHINTLGELKSALSEVANTYNTLADAQKEQSLYGKLSLQTVIDLLSSNINYAQVLDFVTEGENGNITACKLKSDAQKTMVDLQLQAVRTNLQAAMAEEANTIALNNHRLSILGTTDGQIQLEGETDNLIAVNEAATQSTGQLSATLNGLGAALNEIVHLRFTNVKKAYDQAYNATLESLGELDKVDWEKRYEGLTKDQVDAEIAKLKLSNEQAKSRYDAYKLSYNELGNAIQTGNYTGLGEDFGLDTTGKNLKDYDPISKLETLKKLASLIDKEYESMLALQNNRYTEYFKKMGDNLAEQKKAVLEEMALLGAELNSLTPGTEEYDKKYSELNERQADLIDIEKQIANLDDEELEDKMKNLQTIESTIAAQIAVQRELVKAADTEEELIERQKELNELLRKEQETRKNIRDYQKELIDTELEYESGIPNSNRYNELINQKQTLYAEDMVQARLAIQDARNEAYQSFKKSQDMYDDFGNAKYTDDELWDLANNSEKVQEAVKNYIEAFQSAAELSMKVVEDQISSLDKKLDKLENRRPNEWTSRSDINRYYNDRIDLLQDKIDIWEEALEDTSNLTDEQITSLVESINDATKSIQEAKIARREDIKAQDDKYYEAITWQVNQYIDEIELAKKANDDWYDDAIKKLQDYNEDLDRTNELLELQNKLKAASQEKERVYREGKTMPLNSYIG